MKKNIILEIFFLFIFFTSQHLKAAEAEEEADKNLAKVYYKRTEIFAERAATLLYRNTCKFSLHKNTDRTQSIRLTKDFISSLETENLEKMLHCFELGLDINGFSTPEEKTTSDGFLRRQHSPLFLALNKWKPDAVYLILCAGANPNVLDCTRGSFVNYARDPLGYVYEHSKYPNLKEKAYSMANLLIASGVSPEKMPVLAPEKEALIPQKMKTLIANYKKKFKISLVKDAKHDLYDHLSYPRKTAS